VDLKTTGRTHNRIIVLEVFGRYAGHTALRGGIGADADCILIPEIPADFDVVYEHVKKVYMDRIRASDVNAGTYILIVAEGLRDAGGKELVDESAGVDAFGHKRLAGAGKFVRQELSRRFAADPEIPVFMKEQGLFVEELYMAPEVREVRPGHLVRCGRSSAFDVNFGKEGGAAAIFLLLEGLSGITVVEVDGSNILYKPTAEVIEQRLVDMDIVSLYETQGVCFGREPQQFSPVITRHEGKVCRHL
jgi:6-phosphofructokinase 1